MGCMRLKILKLLIIMLALSISAHAADKQCASFINNHLEDLKQRIGYVAGNMSVNKEYDPSSHLDTFPSHYTTQDKAYFTLCSIISSGDKDRLSKYLTHNNFDKNCYNNLYKYCDKSLEGRIYTPADIDLKWGAYKATGDVKYVELLIDNLNDWLAQSQIASSDLQYATLIMHNYASNKDSNMLSAIIKKYPKDTEKFIMSQMALWSFGSMAKEDSNVDSAAILHAQKKDYKALIPLLQTSYFSSACQSHFGLSTSKSLLVLPGEKHKFVKTNGSNLTNLFDDLKKNSKHFFKLRDEDAALLVITAATEYDDNNQEQAVLLDPYTFTYITIAEEVSKRESKDAQLSISSLNVIDKAGAYFIVFLKKAHLKKVHEFRADKFDYNQVSKTSHCSFIHLGFN